MYSPSIYISKKLYIIDGEKMSQPLANFRYVGPITKKTLPSRIVDEWETNLKNARARILASLSRFLDPTTGPAKFLDQIADASSDNWELFVNPSYPNANLIKMKQRVKLAKAYPQYKSGVESAFAPGGIFETRVSDRKGVFSENVKYTIGSVGFKPELSWGPASKVALIVTGDTRVVRYITSPEEFSGSPANMFPTMGQYVRPMIVSTLTFGGVLGLYAQEQGLTDLLNSLIQDVNNKLSEIKKLAKTCAQGGSFTLELRYDPSKGLYAYTEAVNC